MQSLPRLAMYRAGEGAQDMNLPAHPYATFHILDRHHSIGARRQRRASHNRHTLARTNGPIRPFPRRDFGNDL